MEKLWVVYPPDDIMTMLTTIFVYNLDENNNYQVKSYQDDTPIVSSLFPELKLTAQKVFNL